MGTSRALGMPKRKDIGSGEISGDALQPQKRTSIPAQVPVDGPRSVLHDFNSLDKLVETLQKCKRIVVVTGAGIRSVPSIKDMISSEIVTYPLYSDQLIGVVHSCEVQ